MEKNANIHKETAARISENCISENCMSEACMPEASISRPDSERNSCIYSAEGPEVSLDEMLCRRECRVHIQQRLMESHPSALISFTMNIPGPVKDSELIRLGFDLGLHRLRSMFKTQGIELLHEEEQRLSTGPEAFFAVSHDPFSLKELCCLIEDQDELGRLFDIDIIKPDGKKVSREDVGQPSRGCIICGSPGAQCARARKHSLPELRSRVISILYDAVNQHELLFIRQLCSRALLYEVCTAPKPGLVDRCGNGSHRDMDIYTFIDSTLALEDYFGKCFIKGRQGCFDPPQEVFRSIRPLGRLAEQRMYDATGGVNTHKGAIFSLGMVSAALGMTKSCSWRRPEAVLSLCSDMAKGIVAKELESLNEGSLLTAGQRLYLRYGITGIRGQAEAGFSAVISTGLPVLAEGLKRGYSLERSGCAALLWIMTAAADTNLISRGGMDAYKQLQKKLRSLLKRSAYPSFLQLKALDKYFMERNLSPGGSADLLALTYLFYFLQTEDKGLNYDRSQHIDHIPIRQQGPGTDRLSP